MNHDQQDDGFDSPAAARARAIFDGKKTAKVEGRVSDELKEALRRRLADAGFQSESEWIEYSAAVFVYGFEHVRMVQEQRLRRVCPPSAIAPTTGGPAA